MDIRSLRLFQHLANSLHFSKTADAMYVSPPTLSRIITRLEEETKSQLFVRNNRSVKLTNAGRLLLAFADGVLYEYAELKQQLDNVSDKISGELNVYCSVTASQSYLPEILDKLREQYPLVDIQLETGDHSLAFERVQNRQADLALAIYNAEFPSHVQFQQIDVVPLNLVVPKNLNIESAEGLDWQQTKVILPARDPAKRIVNQWFVKHNIRPNVYAKVSGNEAIVTMVSLGFGVGFVPNIVLQNSVVKSKVKSLPVSDVEAYRLGICYLKERANEPLLKSISQLFVHSSNEHRI